MEEEATSPNRLEFRPASERFADVFGFLASVVDFMAGAIDGRGLPEPRDIVEYVHTAAVLKAYNLLKSIRLLAGNDHWESGLILVRSMFELALNMEELGRSKDREAAMAVRFVRFELLQQYRHLRAEADYEVATRRVDQVDPRLTAIEADLPGMFPEWAVRRRDGSIKWKTSWCGKTVKDLCQASGSRVRMGQYEIVYAQGSDMAHSSPHGVLSSFHLDGSDDLEKLLEQSEAKERKETLQVVSLGVTFAFEVIGRSRLMGRVFDAKGMLDIFLALYRLHGVEPPKDVKFE